MAKTNTKQNKLKRSVKNMTTENIKTPVTEESNKTIKIAGNAMVLTSKLDFKTIQKLEKYNSDALCLVKNVNEHETEEIFRIGTGASSSISKYGVTFAEADKNGKAIATVLLPENVVDKKAYIKDNFGNALFMLKDLEDAAATSCAAIEAAYAELDKEIVEL